MTDPMLLAWEGTSSFLLFFRLSLTKAGSLVALRLFFIYIFLKDIFHTLIRRNLLSVRDGGGGC